MADKILSRIMAGKGIPVILIELLKGPNSARELVFDCRLDERTVGRTLRELVDMKMARKIEAPKSEKVGRQTQHFYELTTYGKDIAEVVKVHRIGMIDDIGKVMRKHHIPPTHQPPHQS